MPGGDSNWRRIFRAWRCHLSEKPFDDLELDCKELMQSLNVCSTAFNCCDSRWCGHWRFIRWQMGLNLNVCQTSDHFQGKHQILALGWCIFTQWLDVSTSCTNIGCMRKRCHVEIVSQLRKGFPKKQVTVECDHFHVTFMLGGEVFGERGMRSRKELPPSAMWTSSEWASDLNFWVPKVEQSWSGEPRGEVFFASNFLDAFVMLVRVFPVKNSKKTKASSGIKLQLWSSTS